MANQQSGADKPSIRKHAPGCYRMTLRPFLGDERFAQFVKGRFTSSIRWGDEFKRDSNGRHWKVELRYTKTGEIIRFAGVHTSLRDAMREVIIA